MACAVYEDRTGVFRLAIDLGRLYHTHQYGCGAWCLNSSAIPGLGRPARRSVRCTYCSWPRRMD